MYMTYYCFKDQIVKHDRACDRGNKYYDCSIGGRYCFLPWEHRILSDEYFII